MSSRNTPATDETVARCTAEAALSTDGVYALSPGIGDTIQKNILGKDSVFKGIRIGHDDDAVTIDVYVLANYGANIPAVSWKIQENVKKSVESETEYQIKAVNIHIQGVRLKEGKQRNGKTGA